MQSELQPLHAPRPTWTEPAHSRTRVPSSDAQYHGPDPRGSSTRDVHGLTWYAREAALHHPVDAAPASAAHGEL
eukprot:3528808-Prymnesium_polylepis.2